MSDDGYGNPEFEADCRERIKKALRDNKTCAHGNVHQDGRYCTDCATRFNRERPWIKGGQQMSEANSIKIIKARIVPNLIDMIESELPMEGHREDAEFLRLRDRIQGQVVELRFVGDDAFEVADNNYWLPASCWQEVASDE